MKNLKLNTLVLAIGLTFASSNVFAADEAPAAAQQQAEAPAPLVITDPVANIGGKPFSKADYEKILTVLNAQGQPAPPTKEALQQLLDQIAMQRYFFGEAKKNKLDESPEVKEQLLFAEQGLLASMYLKNYVDTLEITEDELKAEYDKEVTAFGKKEYNASHILVDSEEKAQQIIADITAKKITFEDAAKQDSQDGSGKDGGSLGWFGLNTMIPEFSAAVETLEKGAMTTEPVKTQFGFHIIRLDDTRDVTPPEFDALKPQLENALKQQKMQEMFESVRNQEKVELLVK